jgi:hypothetical protein
VQPTVGDRIAHIDMAIDNIRTAMAGQTKASFAADVMLRMAVDAYSKLSARRHVTFHRTRKSRNPISTGGGWLT